MKWKTIKDTRTDPEDMREHYGTVWLATFQDLLDWPKPLVWLFAPCNEKQPYPGDLVGLDEGGNLVMVEAKYVSSANTTCAPFEDFVPLRKDSATFKADALKKRWSKMWKKEQKRWLDRREADFTTGERAVPGVLPYSRKRHAWGEWPLLYRKATKELRQKTYEEQVNGYLDERRRARNPKPFFVGYVVLGEGRKEVRLTGKDQKNRMKLIKQYGDDRVLLYSVRLRPTKLRAKVECERVAIP